MSGGKGVGGSTENSAGNAGRPLRPFPKPQAPFDAEAALASLERKDVDEQIDTLEEIADGLSAELSSD